MQIRKNLAIKAKYKLYSLKISSKIMLFLGIIVVLSLSLSGILYGRVYYSSMVSKVSEISVQNLKALEANIDALITNADNCSTMIYSEPIVQECLKNSDYDTYSKYKMGYYIRRIMGITRNISSIFTLDNYKARYFTSRSQAGNLPFEIDYENKTKWYPIIAKKKGAQVVLLNGGDVFKNKRKEKFISCMRIINNMDSQKPIGMVIINISENDIKKSFGKTLKNADTKFILKDEKGQVIIASENLENIEFDELISGFEDGKINSQIIEINSKKHIVSYLKLEKYNWKLISIIPFNQMPKNNLFSAMIFFLIIVINSVLILIGSAVVAKSITRPINRLLKSIKENENGELKEAEFETSILEMANLREGYNMMIIEIKKLVNRIIIEQKIKRKAELEVLQSQIKPHFLYNTFDSISSLAMMGKNEEVCEALNALGQYYRTSLSKGLEVISVEQEIETVKNYLSIQKIRYGDIFSAEYSIDEEIFKYKMLKLILQPLAENALYHGIKPKGESGIIKISAFCTGKNICISVEDDGVGMYDEVLSRIHKGDIHDKGGFGLRGTIERLRIFYDKEDVIEIQSRRGEGTKVVISIPIIMEDN